MQRDYKAIGIILIMGLLLIGGFCFGVNFMQSRMKPLIDTVRTVQVIERPVTVRDSVHTKSIMIKTSDTVYFVDKPISIPCGDTAFVAQSDSVITSTRDTINMAFNYAAKKGYFSLVFKPRPDSIITVQLPAVKETKTEWGWVLGALGVGFGLGAIYAK